ncbi:MAG: ABC transporter permease, partial [Deltaproteobacteria bacterium]|nr:ABC transporter permease [Deltaproteobacteria bacterium]
MLSLLRLALRNLTRQRRRTALILAALAFGVTAVVGVRGFLNGLQATVIKGFAEGTVGALQVHAAGFMRSTEAAPLKPNLDLTSDLLQRIEAVKGVRAAAPRVFVPGMVSVGEQTAFVFAVGVDPVRERACCPRRLDLVDQGRFLGASANGGEGAAAESMVGLEVLRGIGGAVGQKAAYITNDIDGVMNAVETDVVARIAAPTQGEKKLALVSLSAAQELLRMPGRATEIAVAVDNLDRVERVAERLREALGPTYEVHTWTELAPTARDALDYQNRALGVVIAAFMVVILVGVANALLTSVLERVREIGTLMAVGARRRQVLVLFLFEAAALGVLGSLLGCAAGSGIVALLAVNGVDLTTPGASLPQHLVPFIRMDFLLRMVGICTIGSIVAALWPAWKASRLRPVEALAGVGGGG